MAGENYLTREGFEKLSKELLFLQTTRRREISKDIEVARLKGDLRENAEYDAAKEAQAFLEKRISELAERLSNVRIIDDENIPHDRVYIGCTVCLEDCANGTELVYTLVSPDEADFAQGNISTVSPIGKGLLRHEVGDTVTITIPAGVLKYVIKNIVWE